MHTTLSITTRALALVAATVAVAGCGSSSGSSSSASATKSSSSAAAPASTSAASAPSHALAVSITNYAYSPATITVTPGAKVTFSNHDATAHTATSTNPGFDTGSINAGKSATVVLKKAGTYSFYCQFHAFMKGTVVVK